MASDFLKIPNEEQASIIKGMIARGDLQQDVAAYFGFNPARIHEVKVGKRHPDVPAAPLSELPPSGPVGLGAGGAAHA